MTVTIKKFGAGEPETLTVFADQHGLTLEVRERGRDVFSTLPRYYVSFSNVEVMTGRGTLSSDAGNGNTPDEALSDYARKLAGRRVAINAMKPNREEINIPNEFHHQAER